MNCNEVLEAIGQLSVVELEQRLKQLTGEVAVTRKLLALARARHRTKTKKKQEPAPAPAPEPEKKNGRLDFDPAAMEPSLTELEADNLATSFAQRIDAASPVANLSQLQHDLEAARMGLGKRYDGLRDRLAAKMPAKAKK